MAGTGGSPSPCEFWTNWLALRHLFIYTFGFSTQVLNFGHLPRWGLDLRFQGDTLQSSPLGVPDLPKQAGMAGYRWWLVSGDPLVASTTGDIQTECLRLFIHLLNPYLLSSVLGK